ncbi:MAG: DUF4145 domain-containing protein [Thermodesulfobacteriota bacterium]
MTIIPTKDDLDVDWENNVALPAISYICGYCGEYNSSSLGYKARSAIHAQAVWTYNFGTIRICSSCAKPSYNREDEFTPGAKFGSDVENISDENLKKLYDEARSCIQVNAFTASIMCSRKMLMNIAVDKGDQEGKSFVQYVEYLADNGYVTKSSKPWVDKIRTLGNDANHKIQILKREDAEELIKFVEMILKTNYEYPSYGKKLEAEEVKA